MSRSERAALAVLLAVTACGNRESDSEPLDGQTLGGPPADLPGRFVRDESTGIGGQAGSGGFTGGEPSGGGGVGGFGWAVHRLPEVPRDPGAAAGVSVADGERIFVPGGAGVNVVDTSDLGQPRHVGVLPARGNMLAVDRALLVVGTDPVLRQKAGSLRLAPDLRGRVQSFDLSVAGVPAAVESAPLAGEPLLSVRRGSYLYVGERRAPADGRSLPGVRDRLLVRAFDLTVPAHPREVAAVESPESDARLGAGEQRAGGLLRNGEDHLLSMEWWRKDASGPTTSLVNVWEFGAAGAPLAARTILTRDDGWICWAGYSAGTADEPPLAVVVVRPGDTLHTCNSLYGASTLEAWSVPRSGAPALLQTLPLSWPRAVIYDSRQRRVYVSGKDGELATLDLAVATAPKLHRQPMLGSVDGLQPLDGGLALVAGLQSGSSCRDQAPGVYGEAADATLSLVDISVPGSWRVIGQQCGGHLDPTTWARGSRQALAGTGGAGTFAVMGGKLELFRFDGQTLTKAATPQLGDPGNDNNVGGMEGILALPGRSAFALHGEAQVLIAQPGSTGPAPQLFTHRFGESVHKLEQNVVEVVRRNSHAEAQMSRELWVFPLPGATAVSAPLAKLAIPPQGSVHAAGRALIIIEEACVREPSDSCSSAPAFSVVDFSDPAQPRMGPRLGPIKNLGHGGGGTHVRDRLVTAQGLVMLTSSQPEFTRVEVELWHLDVAQPGAPRLSRFLLPPPGPDQGPPGPYGLAPDLTAAGQAFYLTSRREVHMPSPGRPQVQNLARRFQLAGGRWTTTAWLELPGPLLRAWTGADGSHRALVTRHEQAPDSDSVNLRIFVLQGRLTGAVPPFEVLGEQIYPSGHIREVFPAGDRLYVVGGAPGQLQVFDLGFRTLLADNTGLWGLRPIGTRGDRLVLAEDGGFFVADLTDLGRPRAVLRVRGGGVFDGDSLYVADTHAGITRRPVDGPPEIPLD